MIVDGGCDIDAALLRLGLYVPKQNVSGRWPLTFVIHNLLWMSC